MEPAKRAKIEFKLSGLAYRSPILSRSKTIEQNGDIFKLNDDCFEAIFNWLTTDDLPILSETCVRIQALVKDYFVRKYSRKCIEIEWVNGIVTIKKYAALKDVIHNMWLKGMLYQRTKQNSDFYNDDHLISFYTFSKCNKQPKSVRFENMLLQRNTIVPLSETLENVESLEFISCEVYKIYENILSRCKNMKHLTVRVCNAWDSNRWLRHQYPTLESLEIQLENSADHSALIEFIKLNPQIKRLICKSRLSSYLSKIQNVTKAIMENELQLRELFLTIGGACDFRTIFESLLIISEQKEFKRLSVEFRSADVKDILIDNLNNLASIKNLHALHITNVDFAEDLPTNIDVLQSLKELHLNNLANCEYSSRMIANVTPNLELLVVRNSCYFTPSVVDFIKPFIAHLPKLRKIVIVHDLWRRIQQNLSLLNEQRQKLHNACIVYIWIQPPTGQMKEKPNISGKTLIRMEPLIDEYEHY